MVTLGYLLAIVMGLTLGLIGAGGSILTMPILVYCMGVPPLLASSHSLLIVGVAALFGAAFYAKQKLIHWRTLYIFAPASVLTVFATRLWLVPAIPDPIGVLPKNTALMLFFAILMGIASFFMLRPVSETTMIGSDLTLKQGIILIAASIGIGLLTGLIGIGGGFLLIPTFVCVFGLPMKRAVGTSLTMTAMNALIGFKSDLAQGVVLNWHLLGIFIAITLVGMMGGMKLSQSIKGGNLKRAFGFFVLIISVGILSRELWGFFEMPSLL